MFGVLQVSPTCCVLWQAEQAWGAEPGHTNLLEGHYEVDPAHHSQLTLGTYRFGSQVNDKDKRVKEKCVVAKVLLFLPAGQEASQRPSTDRSQHKLFVRSSSFLISFYFKTS